MITAHNIRQATSIAKVLGTSRVTHVVRQVQYYVVDDDSDDYRMAMANGGVVVKTLTPVYKEIVTTTGP